MKSTLYAAINIVCLIGLVATFVFSNVLQPKSSSFQSPHNISYTSAEPSRVYRHLEQTQSGLESFALSMKLFASSVKGFDNAFQTASRNLGLRLELSKPSTLALIAAAHNTDGYRPYVITTKFDFGRWHSFDLNIDKQNHIVVSYDGRPNVDETDPELAYEISDIEIGTGFDGGRPFNGQIKDASFSYQFFGAKPTTNGIMALYAVFLVGAVVSVLLLAALARRREQGIAAPERPSARQTQPVVHRAEPVVEATEATTNEAEDIGEDAPIDTERSRRGFAGDQDRES